MEISQVLSGDPYPDGDTYVPTVWDTAIAMAAPQTRWHIPYESVKVFITEVRRREPRMDYSWCRDGVMCLHLRHGIASPPTLEEVTIPPDAAKLLDHQ